MLNAAGVEAVVDFSFHPWGNAYFATDECGTGPYDSDERRCWAKRCGGAQPPPADCFGGIDAVVAQHGEMEAHVNILEACAIRLYPDVPTYWPYVQCVEGDAYDKGSKALEECATRASLDPTRLDGCAAGPGGAQAIAAQAKATPDHPGVPYILVNGKSVNPGSLLEAVCAAYTGVTPEGCKGLKGLRRQGRHPATRAKKTVARQWYDQSMEVLTRFFV